LVPGQHYRITDYETTTSQEYTISAGHQFDIIVTADSENTLNENARAVLHEGDTYFAKSDLSAWELKYDLDNDTKKYKWANSTNGKGVIYYMKDEHNNECPYDFKNIQFKRYKISSFTANFKGNATLQTLLKDSYVGMYDNENNAVPKNTILGDFKWFYTFTCSSSSSNTDDSLLTECYCNVIKPCYTKTTIISTIQTQILNDNVLIIRSTSSECIHSNIFEDNCFGNTLLSDKRMNHFSNYCRYNLLAREVRYASFGYNNSYNIIGKNCYSTKFGNYCHRNIFGENCYANTFSNNCSDNVFYDKCYSNIFGNECGSNILKNECYSNTFGNNCYSNSLHNYCNSNVFKNNCYNNDFGQWCNNITFGDKCYNIIVPNSAVYVDIKNGCHHINCPDHIRNVSFDNGIAYLTVESSSTDSLYVQNMEFKSGISGTSENIKSIYVVRNRSYKTRVEKDKDGKILVWYQKDENTKEGYYYPSISSNERIDFTTEVPTPEEVTITNNNPALS
jgi:hypothetical protein